MKKNNLLFLLSFCTIVLFTQCGDDKDPITFTQAMLDDASSLAVTETGGDFAHGGMMLTGDQTIREIFTNNGDNLNNAKRGDVVTKHTYAKDADGNKGDLLMIFAMFKHEEGYWEAANDWEYVRIAPDPSVDYTASPNGVLSDAALRGNTHNEEPGCVSCHNGAGGGDQLFHND